jgi:hypothetical protein
VHWLFLYYWLQERPAAAWLRSQPPVLRLGWKFALWRARRALRASDYTQLGAQLAAEREATRERTERFNLTFANLAEDRNAYVDELVAANTLCATLRSALAYYADETNYNDDGAPTYLTLAPPPDWVGEDYAPRITLDEGRLARQTLADEQGSEATLADTTLARTYRRISSDGA